MDNLDFQEYVTQGSVLSGQGKYDEAIAFFDRAEKIDKMNIDVYLLKGIAYANLERYDDAKTQFEKALKIDRTSGITYYHLGSIAILQGDIPHGVENYNKAISNGYDDAQLYFSLGLLHEENGEVDMAIRNYSKAIMRDAMRPDIRIRKARLLLHQNQVQEALQVLDETILTNPDVFEGYHLKFAILLQLKEYDKAESTIESALALFPKDPGFIIDRATLLISKDKIDEAFELLDNLEKSDDANNEAKRRVCIEKARIFAEREDLNSTVEFLEKARAYTEQDGDYDEEAEFMLANCFISLEQFDKALLYAQRLLEKAEDGTYKESARYFEPFALKKLGKDDEAEAKYKEAIAKYRRQSLAVPGNLDANTFRLMCLRDIGEYEKAIELSDFLLSLQPNSSELHFLKATVLELMGRTQEAEAESKLSARLRPGAK